MQKNSPKPVAGRSLIILFIGVIAASQSGNLIRLGDAHFAAIAAWRLLFASVLIAALTGRDFSLLKKLTKGEIGLLVSAGAALVLHFFTWIGAVQHTSVADAAMAFSINPIFIAAAAHFIFKERVTKKLVLSIGLGLTGVAIICGNEFNLQSSGISGDLLALMSALFFATYFLLGKRLLQKLPIRVYVSTLYGIASVIAFAVIFIADINAFHFTGKTWLCFLLMALVPTMIGHTAFNYSLRYIDAGRISTATLLEPLFAGIVAFFAYGEKISAAALIGYGFISASVLVLVMDVQKNSEST